MTAPARQPDRIDTAPAFTAERVGAFNRRFAGRSAADMLAELLAAELLGRIAAVSSFGAESAVLVDLVAGIDRNLPLIFVNTQKMFGETLAYRDSLFESLGFSDLRVYRPDPYKMPGATTNLCAGPMIPMAAATCARSNHCAGRWSGSMRGFQAARAFRQAAPACRASSLMKAA